jgi:hypothetical protein
VDIPSSSQATTASNPQVYQGCARPIRSSSFERGFISEESIRNREWDKHLAVALGLWLSQRSLSRQSGAGTLPNHSYRLRSNHSPRSEECDLGEARSQPFDGSSREAASEASTVVPT